MAGEKWSGPARGNVAGITAGTAVATPAVDMHTCSACEGFLPDHIEVCPHCDAALGSDAPAGTRTARRVAQAAGTAAAMMTLMACYGIGIDGEEVGEYEITDPVEACSYADELPENGYVQSPHLQSNAHQGSCGPAGFERIYQYDPGDNLGLEGRITVVWSTPGSGLAVYLRASCDNGPELACGPTSYDGALELYTDDLQPFYVFIDGGPDADESHELQVIFEPCGGSLPCLR